MGKITSHLFPKRKISSLLNNGIWKIEIFLEVGIIITHLYSSVSFAKYI